MLWCAAKVALLSARENSPNLIPVLIFGGAQESASPEALDNLVWFREHGGIVYHHNLTFGADLQVSRTTHCTMVNYHGEYERVIGAIARS